MSRPSPRAATRVNKKYQLTMIIGGVVLVLVFVVLAFPIRQVFFGKIPITRPLSMEDADPLCVYMADTLHLKCVAVLAAESVLGPGNIVANSVSNSTYERVTLPQSNLFSSACLVPGAQSEVEKIQSDLAGQSETNSLALAEFNYTLNREFTAGVDLPVPRYAAMVLKAGPKLDEVQTVTFKAPQAWLKIIDENQLITLLQHAAIADVCIDRLIAKSYRVVSKAAIAQGLDVTVTDRAGKSMSLSAAVKQGKLEVGGAAGTDRDETIRKASEKPLVVGVDFFDSDIFGAARPSLTRPLYSASGVARIQVRGIDGATLEDQASARLGKSFALHWSGVSGVGQCGGAVPPGVDLAGGLTVKQGPSGGQSYEVAPTGTMRGGITTRLELPRGCVSTASTVTADLAFETTIKVVARSSKASLLVVEDNGVYAMSIEVKDWVGQSKPRVPAGGGSEVHKVQFAISGAGVYQVHVSGIHSVRASGGAVVSTFDKGAFTIEVDERADTVTSNPEASPAKIRTIAPVASSGQEEL